jgi:hypothetical protein
LSCFYGFTPIVLHLCFDFYSSISILFIKIGFDKEITNMFSGSTPYCNITENAAQTPHVLIFKPGTRRKSVHLSGNHILSGFYIFRNVKFCSITAIYAETHFHPVNPEKESGIYTIECEEYLPAIPFCRNFKIASVAADRITLLICGKVFRRSAHNIREIPFYNIPGISIIGSTISHDLPVRWNRYFFP